MPKRRVVSGSNLSPSRYCLIGISSLAMEMGRQAMGPPIRSGREIRGTSLPRVFYGP
jgi:hypothetical protein